MSRGITKQAGILVGSIAVFGMVSAAQAATLVDTPRAQWGCELNEEKVFLGITSALISRNWSITKKVSDGKLIARIIVRNKHTLIVEIAYDKTSYDITYESSENLKYQKKDDGTESIHKNANKWIRNIHMDIAKQLSTMCLLQ